MKTKRFMAVVGLAVSLLIGGMAAPAAVSAASNDCSHGSGFDETTMLVAQSAEIHEAIVDGMTVPCTITCTVFRRVTICRSCHAVLAINEYTIYTHSVKH